MAVQVADPTPANLVFSQQRRRLRDGVPVLVRVHPGWANRARSPARILVPSGYTTPDPITNMATVSSNTPDSNPANNIDDHVTTLGPPSADVAVVKTGPATTVPGNPIVYTITVTNNGPSDAADVTLTDPAPANLTFMSNAGDCTTPFPCALGTIPAGQSRVITATFMVPANYTTPSQITNVATVTSDDRRFESGEQHLDRDFVGGRRPHRHEGGGRCDAERHRRGDVHGHAAQRGTERDDGRVAGRCDSGGPDAPHRDAFGRRV